MRAQKPVEIFGLNLCLQTDGMQISVFCKTCTNKHYPSFIAADPVDATVIARVFQEIALGVFDYSATFPGSKRRPDEADTFRAYAANWLATIVCEKSTRQGHVTAIDNVWSPVFGDRRLASIKASEVRKAIVDRARIVSGKTINNNLIPLRGIFNMAVEDELLERSPLAKIKSLSHQKPAPDPFDRSETARILEYLQEHCPEQAWNWYEFAFGSGMRPSEQIVVQWRDVDWTRRTIRVQRARVRHEVKATKTNQVRDVDLTDRMLDVLRRQKSYSFMLGEASPIFLNPTSLRPWPDVQDQRKLYFHPALRALGIRSRDAYQCRHTFATTALMAGINPAYIAKQMGHESAAMLFKRYARWIDGADGGREAQKLNALHQETDVLRLKRR